MAQPKLTRSPALTSSRQRSAWWSILGTFLLADCGPAGSLMSGSGTTLFALCRGPNEARRIASRVLNAREKPVSRAYVVRSCL